MAIQPGGTNPILNTRFLITACKTCQPIVSGNDHLEWTKVEIPCRLFSLKLSFDPVNKF
jgi:hypothetical protein